MIDKDVDEKLYVLAQNIWHTNNFLSKLFVWLFGISLFLGACFLIAAIIFTKIGLIVISLYAASVLCGILAFLFYRSRTYSKESINDIMKHFPQK